MSDILEAFPRERLHLNTNWSQLSASLIISFLALSHFFSSEEAGLINSEATEEKNKNLLEVKAQFVVVDANLRYSLRSRLRLYSDVYLMCP